MLILGIDPGLQGALAWMDAGGTVLQLEDIPVLSEGKGKKAIDALGITAMLTARRPTHAVIEAVHARPTDSKTGAFTFGRNTGALEALVMGAGIPLQRVAPVTWRRCAGLAPGADKLASLAAAMRLHPSCRPMLEGKQARHDRAEAVLNAGWYAVNYGREAA